MFKNQDTTDQYTTDQDTTDQYTTDQDITNLNTFDQDTAVQESRYNWPRYDRPRYNWSKYNQLRYIWSSDQNTAVQESRYDRRRSNWLEYNPPGHWWPGHNWPKSSITMISTWHHVTRTLLTWWSPAPQIWLVSICWHRRPADELILYKVWQACSVQTTCTTTLQFFRWISAFLGACQPADVCSGIK